MSFKTAFQTVGQPVKINNPRAGFEPRTSWFKIPQATNLTQSHWTIQAHYINKLKYLSYGDNATFNSERDIWKKLSKSLIYCLVCTMWHVTCWSFVFGNFPLTWHSLVTIQRPFHWAPTRLPNTLFSGLPKCSLFSHSLSPHEHLDENTMHSLVWVLFHLTLAGLVSCNLSHFSFQLPNIQQHG